MSDQAFYIPAVLHAFDPATFPRDGALIEAQARLMVLDEILAGVMRITGIPLHWLFAAGYVLSLTIIWWSLTAIAFALYAHRWTSIALLAAFTLRHQITRTSANTFEPYFHPRMLAFGICLAAVAAFLRHRPWLAIVLVAIGGAVHPTTAMWFAILLGVAIVVSEPAMRRPLAAGAAAAAIAGAWLVFAGPLAGGFVVIDADWRQVLATKTTLIATDWPVTAWIANLGTACVWAWAYRVRRHHDGASPHDTGLAAGGAALVALFAATLPLVAAGVSFFVELQISRVFWLVDVMATIYLLAAIERRWPAPRIVRAAAIALIAFSTIRGVYSLTVEHPERTLFAFRLAETPWHDAMRWLAAQPAAVHVLADPGHAWKHGTSVRVSAGRDVFLEDVKDAALAIYSRDVAMRVLERGRLVGAFDQLTPQQARDLAAKYDLDYLVTTASLELPVAYRNRQFSIYSLADAR